MRRKLRIDKHSSGDQSKGGSVSNRLARLIQLLYLLQGGSEWNQVKLAELFEVSKRTLFRDVRLLRQAGFPIQSRAPGFGYRLPREMSLRCPQLESAELVAISVALHWLSERPAPSLQRLALSALAKVRNAAPTSCREEADRQLDKILGLKLVPECLILAAEKSVNTYKPSSST